MARKHVRVRVLKSFNGLRKGDESAAVMDERLKAWVDMGLLEVIDDGASAAGPGGAEQDNNECVQDGAPGSGPAGGEPGPGFGSGGYGSSEGFDQG